MKEELIKHISTIFSELQIVKSFEVLECKIDVLPEWTNQILLTHEFLIYCEQLSDKKKLQGFLGKKLYQLKNIVYWFEGEQIIEIEKSELEFKPYSEDNLIEEKFEYLKTETSLPSWLDDFIFNKLNAEYAPNFERFDYNLDLTEDENKKYLGTYFPRSYAESFCIFDNIFQNTKFQKGVFHKDSLNILSLGCGTGGDLIGLLAVIEKHCDKNMMLNIWAVDGNKKGLDVLFQIVEMFKTLTNKKINLKILNLVLDTETGRYTANKEIIERKYDFILSFKMINEIISAGKGICDNAYFHFLKTFIPLLFDNGLCVLLDVTTKQEHCNTYNPILLNNQINNALRELENYKTVLPLSCNLYEKCCQANCFMQQHFFVSHSQRRKDISKVAYRVIANVVFADQLAHPDITVKYLIGKDMICCYTGGNNKKEDSYLLKSN